MPNGSSDPDQSQEALRAAALWAAEPAEEALPIFESRHPGDPRLRQAIEAGRTYGQGKRRDKELRARAMEVFKIGSTVDDPSKYVTKAASAVAAMAYTHTDLTEGKQGIRQARHILGPVIYAALALELAHGDPSLSENLVAKAIRTAPEEVRTLIRSLPPQPGGTTRLENLFAYLDAALRQPKPSGI